MAETTAISFCDATWNCWQGCAKVSAGCAACYMFREMKRYNKNPNIVVRSSDATFYAPIKKRAWQAPMRIFTCSWSDFFIAEADAWRADAWDVIRATPQHTYQIITKRVERIAACLPNDWATGPLGGPNGWPHVQLIATVEHQKTAWRASVLQGIPAKCRGLICEPLLGPLFLAPYLETGLFHWVIAGGESGPTARVPHPGWFYQLRDDCARYRIPFHFKQWGEWGPAEGHDAGELRGVPVLFVAPDGTFFDGGECYDRQWLPPITPKLRAWLDRHPGAVPMYRWGKRSTGRLLDLVLHNAFPPPLPTNEPQA